MPVSVPGIVGVMVPNLISVAMIGSGVPQYCRGVANGLVKWVPLIKVQTVDVGTLGVGTCVPTPVLVPNPLLYANFLAGLTANGLLGPLSPAFALGVTNGLVLSFAQMLITTTNPSVGIGTAVARFSALPATPFMIAGFAEAGMVGLATVRKARAIAMALDSTFASLVLPLAIVGPPAPSPGAGAGFGQIV